MNFDPVADIYDATRGLPDGVPSQIADAIAHATNAQPGTRFLELGVGTGRIAEPLIERGYPFTGVDISSRMLDRLRQKVGDAANLTLIEGSITDLPLPDASQDVIVVIHVFHLVEEWKKAFAEARRVLAPGGYFIFGGNHSVEADGRHHIRRKWTELVREAGGTLSPRHAAWEDIQEAVTADGGWTATYRAAHWERELRPLALMAAMRQRTFSASWSVEEEVLERVHEQLVGWGKERFGDLTKPVSSVEEFLLFVSRFPAP